MTYSPHTLADTKRHLEGLRFPATRTSVIAHMRERQAPNKIIDQVQQHLPDRKYHDMTDLAGTLGGTRTEGAERAERT